MLSRESPPSAGEQHMTSLVREPHTYCCCRWFCKNNSTSNSSSSNSRGGSSISSSSNNCNNHDSHSSNGSSLHHITPPICCSECSDMQNSTDYNCSSYVCEGCNNSSTCKTINVVNIFQMKKKDRCWLFLEEHHAVHVEAVMAAVVTAAAPPASATHGKTYFSLLFSVWLFSCQRLYTLWVFLLFVLILYFMHNTNVVAAPTLKCTSYYSNRLCPIELKYAEPILIHAPPATNFLIPFLSSCTYSSRSRHISSCSCSSSFSSSASRPPSFSLSISPFFGCMPFSFALISLLRSVVLSCAFPRTLFLNRCEISFQSERSLRLWCTDTPGKHVFTQHRLPPVHFTVRKPSPACWCSDKKKNHTLCYTEYTFADFLSRVQSSKSEIQSSPRNTFFFNRPVSTEGKDSSSSLFFFLGAPNRNTRKLCRSSFFLGSRKAAFKPHTRGSPPRMSAASPPTKFAMEGAPATPPSAAAAATPTKAAAGAATPPPAAGADTKAGASAPAAIPALAALAAGPAVSALQPLAALAASAAAEAAAVTPPATLVRFCPSNRTASLLRRPPHSSSSCYSCSSSFCSSSGSSPSSSSYPFPPSYINGRLFPYFVLPARCATSYGMFTLLQQQSLRKKKHRCPHANCCPVNLVKFPFTLSSSPSSPLFSPTPTCLSSSAPTSILSGGTPTLCTLPDEPRTMVNKTFCRPASFTTAYLPIKCLATEKTSPASSSSSASRPCVSAAVRLTGAMAGVGCSSSGATAANATTAAVAAAAHNKKMSSKYSFINSEGSCSRICDGEGMCTQQHSEKPWFGVATRRRGGTSMMLFSSPPTSFCFGGILRMLPFSSPPDDAICSSRVGAASWAAPSVAATGAYYLHNNHTPTDTHVVHTQTPGEYTRRHTYTMLSLAAVQSLAMETFRKSKTLSSFSFLPSAIQASSIQTASVAAEVSNRDVCPAVNGAALSYVHEKVTTANKATTSTKNDGESESSKSASANAGEVEVPNDRLTFKRRTLTAEVFSHSAELPATTAAYIAAEFTTIPPITIPTTTSIATKPTATTCNTTVLPTSTAMKQCATISKSPPRKFSCSFLQSFQRRMQCCSLRGFYCLCVAVSTGIVWWAALRMHEGTIAAAAGAVKLWYKILRCTRPEINIKRFLSWESSTERKKSSSSQDCTDISENINSRSTASNIHTNRSEVSDRNSSDISNNNDSRSVYTSSSNRTGISRNSRKKNGNRSSSVRDEDSKSESICESKCSSRSGIISDDACNIRSNLRHMGNVGKPISLVYTSPSVQNVSLSSDECEFSSGENNCPDVCKSATSSNNSDASTKQNIVYSGSTAADGDRDVDAYIRDERVPLQRSDETAGRSYTNKATLVEDLPCQHQQEEDQQSDIKYMNNNASQKTLQPILGEQETFMNHIQQQQHSTMACLRDGSLKKPHDVSAGKRRQQHKQQQRNEKQPQQQVTPLKEMMIFEKPEKSEESRLLVNNYENNLLQRLKDWGERWCWNTINVTWGKLFLRLSGGFPVVEGLEHLPPKTENAIYVANHCSHADVMLLAVSIHRHLRFVGKEELQHFPVVGLAMRLSGCLFVNRSDPTSRLALFRKALLLLHHHDQNRRNRSCNVRKKPVLSEDQHTCKSHFSSPSSPEQPPSSNSCSAALAGKISKTHAPLQGSSSSHTSLQDMSSSLPPFCDLAALSRNASASATYPSSSINNPASDSTSIAPPTTTTTNTISVAAPGDIALTPTSYPLDKFFCLHQSNKNSFSMSAASSVPLLSRKLIIRYLTSYCHPSNNILRLWNSFSIQRRKSSEISEGKSTQERETEEQNNKGENKDGIALVAFPEGRRSLDGRLMPFDKGGFFRIAEQAGVCVVPVTIIGAPLLLPAGAWLPPAAAPPVGSIRVIFHPPISPKNKTHEQLREESWKAIASALPVEQQPHSDTS